MKQICAVVFAAIVSCRAQNDDPVKDEGAIQTACAQRMRIQEQGKMIPDQASCQKFLRSIPKSKFDCLEACGSKEKTYSGYSGCETKCFQEPRLLAP